jgi:hypothetical protein
MMLRNVIGAKASLIACRGNFQSVVVLLANAAACVIQMIKNAETEGGHRCTTHGRFHSTQQLHRCFRGNERQPARFPRFAGSRHEHRLAGHYYLFDQHCILLQVS